MRCRTCQKEWQSVVAHHVTVSVRPAWWLRSSALGRIGVWQGGCLWFHPLLLSQDPQARCLHSPCMMWCLWASEPESTHGILILEPCGLHDLDTASERKRRDLIQVASYLPQEKRAITHDRFLCVYGMPSSDLIKICLITNGSSLSPTHNPTV